MKAKKENFLNTYHPSTYGQNSQDWALDHQNIYVNHSGDFGSNPGFYVHNSCELLFFEEGECQYRICNQVYEMGPNDILIIGATDPHSRIFTKPPSYRFGLTLIPAFIQSLPVIRDFAKIYQTHSVEEAQKLRHIDDVVFERMLQILIQLHEETEDNGEGKGDMVYALLLELTIYLKRLLNYEKKEIMGMEKTMQELKSYVDQYYAEDLSLGRLSEIFYLQPNTISKYFSKYYDKNLNQYINAVRITNAVRILQESDISITELAEEVGYSSVNTFLRQFKTFMAISPLQYKKNQEKSETTMQLSWKRIS